MTVPVAHRRIAALAIIGAWCALLGACTGWATSPPKQPTITHARPSAAVSRSVTSTAEGPNRLRISLAIPQTRIHAGDRIQAQILITNLSNRTVDLPGRCDTPFKVVFANKLTVFGIPDALIACPGNPVKPGATYHSTFPVQASYTSWPNSCVSQPMPCAPAGPPTLPPGQYWIEPYSPILPTGSSLPSPIPVTILAS
jgi:hypothetical protein